MQEVSTTLPIGTIVRGQYVVEDVLGRGEFTAIYLVSAPLVTYYRDKNEGKRRASWLYKAISLLPAFKERSIRDKGDRQRLFALKEVSRSGGSERERDFFEMASLKRLHHPALPHVYDVFNDNVQGRTYLLMDYLEGPSLETLRQGQPEQGFSLPQVMTLIAPIMDAVIYLHNQSPPIIHGDIKPANIIVSKAGGTTILVDFGGLAREFEAETPPTTARHGTSGYTAPDQQRRRSTRTDIYALGAVLYTLFTGRAPVDALARLAQLSEKKPDPLVPVDQIVPTVPTTIARAIHRAMSVSPQERFSTVEQFWEALWQVSNTAPRVQQTIEPVARARPGEKAEADADTEIQRIAELATETPQDKAFASSASSVAQRASDPLAARVVPLHLPLVSQKGVKTPAPVPLREHPRISRSNQPGKGRFLVLALFVTLLISTGIGTGIWLYTTGPDRTSSALPTVTGRYKATPPSAASPNATATPGTPPYPKVVQSYSGTIYSIPGNRTTGISLRGITQRQESMSGSFTGLGVSGPFNGTINTTGHVQFTVIGNAGRTTLSFDGVMQTDGSIGGTYCGFKHQAGECSDYGVWSITPTVAEKFPSILIDHPALLPQLRPRSP